MASPTHALGLAIADRRRSADFYRTFLEQEPFGPVAADGLPEPLQFQLAPATTLLLVPSTGFNWVLGGDRRVGGRDAVGGALTWIVDDEQAVRAAIARAEASGAEVVVQAAMQPWQVFAGVVADPDGHLWVVQDRAM